MTGDTYPLRARDFGGGDKRVYLGEASVDGGELLIVDPAYLPDEKATLIDEIRGEAPSRGWGGPVLKNRWRSGDRLAVLVRLESDGGYPVWAEQSPEGDLLRVTIEIAQPEAAET